ncbi:MAG TPA: hypothetical protein PJ991_04200 [Kiritimatiellia bacterium]|mgnify:CR=1 FL=1|nr:hypothetical protein [Kiritimatiellia bacterium]
MILDTPYFKLLRDRIEALGGMYNAHLHLDRSGTLAFDGGFSGSCHLSISTKHQLIPHIHAGPAYDPDNLERRVSEYLDALVATRSCRADTLVDVTADRVGTSALEVFLELKARFAAKLDLRVGAYSPLGFKDSEPERWALLCEAARRADLIGSLPERDDHVDYPDHIGFREHCRRILSLAMDLDRGVHMHVDQRNHPLENGAEIALDVIEELQVPAMSTGEPRVWFVHFISPSTYEESRFQRLLDRLLKHRVGVICCPSAAISMNQLRQEYTPTGNSIARVLELIAAGVPVRVGSDNVCDITSPAGTPDLMAEMYVLANAVRYYDIDVLAHLAAGLELPASCRERVRVHLAKIAEESGRALKRLRHTNGFMDP